jgi:hypothetical protein
VREGRPRRARGSPASCARVAGVVREGRPRRARGSPASCARVARRCASRTAGAGGPGLGVAGAGDSHQRGVPPMNKSRNLRGVSGLRGHKHLVHEQGPKTGADRAIWGLIHVPRAAAQPIAAVRRSWQPAGERIRPPPTPVSAGRPHRAHQRHRARARATNGPYERRTRAGRNGDEFATRRPGSTAATPLAPPPAVNVAVIAHIYGRFRRNGSPSRESGE